MNCTNCDLPLTDGPPQTCPRCFTVNPEQFKREQEEREKPRRRPRRSRKGRRAPESPPASEPGTDTEQE